MSSSNSTTNLDNSNTITHKKPKGLNSLKKSRPIIYGIIVAIIVIFVLSIVVTGSVFGVTLGLANTGLNDLGRYAEYNMHQQQGYYGGNQSMAMNPQSMAMNPQSTTMNPRTGTTEITQPYNTVVEGISSNPLIQNVKSSTANMKNAENKILKGDIQKPIASKLSSIANSIRTAAAASTNQ